MRCCTIILGIYVYMFVCAELSKETRRPTTAEFWHGGDTLSLAERKFIVLSWSYDVILKV